MKLTVVGSGDAFGSGGRLQTCFHLAVEGSELLIDCGATSLTGLFRAGIDPNRIGAILVTHLHGDHFGGLVWFLLHAHYNSGRERPLTLVGPPTLKERLEMAANALFPRLMSMERRFELEFRTLVDGQTAPVGPAIVTPVEVSHPCGAPPFALRVEAGSKAIGFSGDTEWTDRLIAVAQGADLFVSECYSWDVPVGYHMSWRTIEANLDRLGARKVLLTHMGEAMLARCGEVRDGRVTCAEDGMAVEV